MIDDVAFVAIHAPEPGQVMVTSTPCVPAGVGTVNERGAGPVFAPAVHPVPLALTVGDGVLDGEVEGAGAPDPVPTPVHPVSEATTAMATTSVHAFLDRTFPPKDQTTSQIVPESASGGVASRPPLTLSR